MSLKITFSFFKWLAWLIGFAGCAWFLQNYEVLMNYGNLDASGFVMVFRHTTNLANEGVIGYFSLGLIALCVVMWVKESFNFQKDLRSLATSEQRCDGELMEVNV